MFEEDKQHNNNQMGTCLLFKERPSLLAVIHLHRSDFPLSYFKMKMLLYLNVIFSKFRFFKENKDDRFFSAYITQTFSFSC